MRRSLLVAMIALLPLALGGAANAFPQSGPPGGSGSTFVNGVITCGHTNTFLDAPVVVYNDGQGVEVCSDSGPVQGRVGAFHDLSATPFTIQYIYVDVTSPVGLGEVLFLQVPIV